MKKKQKKIINILNSINKVFLKNKLIKPNQQILIAISGGQDSISILFICFILKKQWNLEIITLYCHHLWQIETFYTFLHLEKISFIFQLNFFYSITLNLINSEQKGRNWRLKLYLRFLRFLKINLLLTGHTDSDQIETFFFNLLRGSGLNGISSLKLKRKLNQYKKNSFFISKFDIENLKKFKQKRITKTKKFNFDIKKAKHIKKNYKINSSLRIKKIYFYSKLNLNEPFIISPLISQSRFDIQKICNYWKLPILPDKSNLKTFSIRNRIRKQVLPSLRFFFNPQIERSLSKYNQILMQEQKILEKLLILSFQEIIFENNNFFCLNLAVFHSFPPSLQTKICFYIFKKNLYISTNFYLIDRFNNFLGKNFLERKKINKNFNFTNWFFFPRIGSFFFYKTILIFIKL